MTRAKPAPETVTVHIPFRLVKRGGRKEMQLPDGASAQRKMDNTLVKALARAFRWKQMLESGEFATIGEPYATGTRVGRENPRRHSAVRPNSGSASLPVPSRLVGAEPPPDRIHILPENVMTRRCLSGLFRSLGFSGLR